LIAGISFRAGSQMLITVSVIVVRVDHAKMLTQLVRDAIDIAADIRVACIEADASVDRVHKHQMERNLREAKEAGLLSGRHCGVCLEVWVCLSRCSFVTLSRYIFLWLFGLLHAKYQRLQNLWLCGESTVWKRDSFVVNYQSPRAPVLD
jgi:hypothetical protein